MKKSLIILAALVTFGCAQSANSEDVDNSSDEQEINLIFEGLKSAWSAGDGAAWGSHFTENADFTVWFGFRLSGAQAIAAGHQDIFDGFYDGTVFDIEPASIRFITNDVALAHLNGWIYADGDARPEGDAVAHPLAVVRRTDDGWKIEAFQNTPNFGPQCFGNSMKDAIANGGCMQRGG